MKDEKQKKVKEEKQKTEKKPDEKQSDYRELYEALVKENEEIIKENESAKNSLAEAEKKLKDADAAAVEAQDKYLRMMAEYDNFRKRSAKEKEEIYSDACADALKEILPVADNLERALGAEGTDQVTAGLKMIMNQLGESLKKLGVESFGEVGEKFDPNLHNAVMHDEDAGRGENEISEVFLKGYRRGDRIIRHCMVKVVN